MPAPMREAPMAPPITADTETPATAATLSKSSAAIVAVVLGARGGAGQCIVKALLANPGVREVGVLGEPVRFSRADGKTMGATINVLKGT